MRMEPTAAFEAWLAEGGARWDGVRIGATSTGRGVRARRPIAAGEVLVRVPRRLLVTTEQVERTAIGRAIELAGVELSGSHALHAAWLAVEDADPRSRWQPYLAMLPRDQRAFPIHATPEERALLDGTIAGALVDDLRTAVVLDHVALQAHLPAFAAISRDALTWARLIAGSRLFSATIDDEDTAVLAPFADLLDHARAAGATWSFDPEGRAFVITAVRDLAAGEEVCVHYGDKSNARLLVQYGFCVDDNPHDEADLAVPAPFRVTRDPEAAASREMLDWLRAHDLDPRAAIADAARTALAALGPDDEDAQLARAELSANARAFLRARRGERDVLRAWLALAPSLATR